jgi:hypothetical protein
MNLMLQQSLTVIFMIGGQLREDAGNQEVTLGHDHPKQWIFFVMIFLYHEFQ